MARKPTQLTQRDPRRNRPRVAHRPEGTGCRTLGQALLVPALDTHPRKHCPSSASSDLPNTFDPVAGEWHGVGEHPVAVIGLEILDSEM